MEKRFGPLATTAALWALSASAQANPLVVADGETVVVPEGTTLTADEVTVQTGGTLVIDRTEAIQSC